MLPIDKIMFNVYYVCAYMVFSVYTYVHILFIVCMHISVHSYYCKLTIDQSIIGWSETRAN